MDPIKAARLQKLQTIEFDRRPSTIMKTWSTPLKDKPEKPEILIEDEKIQAERKAQADAQAKQDSAVKPPNDDSAKDGENPSEDQSPTEAKDGDAPPADQAGGQVDKQETVEGAEEKVAEDEAADDEVAEDEVTEDEVTEDEVAEGESGLEDKVTTELDESSSEDAPPTAETEEAQDESTPPVPSEEELAAQAEKAKKEAEEAKRVAEVQAAKTKYDNEMLEWELEKFRRSVTLSLWDEVKTYLAELEEDEQKIAYSRLLTSLMSGPARRPQTPPQGRNYIEKNVFAPEDIMGIAAASPSELEETHLKSISGLFKQCLAAGNLLETFIPGWTEALKAETFPLSQRQLAIILADAGQEIPAKDFLPSLKEAQDNDDRGGLNLLARSFLALHRKDRKTELLEQAWTATQSVLAIGDVEKKQKEEALKRAVELAPRIRDTLGDDWLQESFTTRPERGQEILASIGASASLALQSQPTDANGRLKWLELQATAANSLLAAAPERAQEWADPLDLMARNWLREAEFTYQNDQSTKRGPSLQRDVYGNFFYYDLEYQQNYRYSGNRPTPIASGKILETTPSDLWMNQVAVSIKPNFRSIVAKLHLKVGEEEEAFPFIEALAETHPDPAKELVDEFLRVWARNHNPNQNTRNNSYVYIYGYEQRAGAIPLTRSKQERNLKELSEWVARLRNLPVELDTTLLANAFTAAHSTAEIYRLETIANVFGSLENLEPETLSQLLQKMRANLVGVWRNPNTQKDAKTNRRKKDIEREVSRGYELASAVVDAAMKEHPDNWSLSLVSASLKHDYNNYIKDLRQEADFAGRRRAAFAEFAGAAQKYLDFVADAKETEETSQVFETWFYAALGACDLGAINQDHVVAQGQISLIRQAIEDLPGERAERHMGKFANALFTRMGSANPAVKFRYVRSGLEIAGNHELAQEAIDVLEYYEDLVTEIQLDVTVDGSDQVGSEKPFGVFVDIRHTREIERESGGFNKYLVNQNNQMYSFNYGRPTENYRDKFEEAAREALKENFEILSITFNHPKTNSRATADYGWRITPYAYILLKPRGPEIDKIPSLRFDLDFLDTSGYAVIPIESSPTPVDAAEPMDGPRPFERMALTQTLDERQAKDGKLILEIKASALGLVPEMENCVDLAPEGFIIDDVSDNGVSVVKYDEESDDPMVLSERLWTVTMTAEEKLTELPKEFSFAKPLVEVSENEFLRYVDADLETVEATIPLEYTYGEESSPWLTRSLIAGLALAFVALVAFFGLRQSKGENRVDSRFRMPDAVTPFTVIGLLRDIEQHNGLAAPEREQLNSQIRNLEDYYFVNSPGEEPNLQEIARSWVQRSV